MRACEPSGTLLPRMRVLIMGCGRVGSELSIGLLQGGHHVTVIDKNPEAFIKYPPGDGARQVIGLGFDRDVLEDAGIKEADGFIAVSSGDNSNIVSARVRWSRWVSPRTRSTAASTVRWPTALTANTTTLSRDFETEDAQTGVKSFLENGPGKATFSGR